MTRLCVPLTASTCREMARQIDAAATAGAEMIELRLDYLREWDAEAIGELMSKAEAFGGDVIVTCRLDEEGGQYHQDESQRMRLMALAAAGADYLDVEYEAYGMKWSSATDNPTDAQLATASNWDEDYQDHRQFKVVKGIFNATL